MRAIFPLLLSLLIASLSPMAVSTYGQQTIQVESEGDLEATLNGESFTTGQTITISGTVEGRVVDAFVNIDVIDPESTMVIQVSPPITADDTFTYSFEAGAEEGFDILEPMVRSGNYRVVVSFFENSGDFDIYEVEFAFEYTPTSAASPPAQLGPPEVGGEEEQQTTSGGAGGAAIGITPQQAVPSPSLQPRLFQSNNDGVRVEIPLGWVADDRYNGTDPLTEQVVRQHGGKYIGALCPQDQTLPAAGGLYSCQLQSSTGVGVVLYVFDDLQSRPEFATLSHQNKSITTSDLLGHYFGMHREIVELGLVFSPYVEIVSDTDVAVYVFDPQTNQTIGRTPAKYVEFIESYPDGTSYRDFLLVALTNDTNTGYVLRPLIQEGVESGSEAPPFVRSTFDSFQLVTLPNTPVASAPATQTPPVLSQPLTQEQQPSPSPFSQQLQLQQELQSP
jgi:hypothetical protein